MAVQFHVAFSETVRGAGITAGGNIIAMVIGIRRITTAMQPVTASQNFSNKSSKTSYSTLSASQGPIIVLKGTHC